MKEFGITAVNDQAMFLHKLGMNLLVLPRWWKASTTGRRAEENL